MAGARPGGCGREVAAGGVSGGAAGGAAGGGRGRGRGCGGHVKGPAGRLGRAAYGLRIVLALASPPCAAAPTTPLTRALTVAAGTFETIGFT